MPIHILANVSRKHALHELQMINIYFILCVLELSQNTCFIYNSYENDFLGNHAHKNRLKLELYYLLGDF